VSRGPHRFDFGAKRTNARIVNGVKAGNPRVGKSSCASARERDLFLHSRGLTAPARAPSG